MNRIKQNILFTVVLVSFMLWQSCQNSHQKPVSPSPNNTSSDYIPEVRADTSHFKSLGRKSIRNNIQINLSEKVYDPSRSRTTFFIDSLPQARISYQNSSSDPIFHAHLTPAISDSLAEDNATMFGFIFDNDFWFMHDYYYSSGASFYLVSDLWANNPVNHILIRPRRFYKTYYRLRLDQKMYTPTILNEDRIIYGDRPFASSLTATFSAESYHPEKGWILSNEWQLGIMGRYALGQDIQTLFHTSDDPIGWKYQIRTDLLINYNINVQKQLLSKQVFEWFAGLGGNLGSLQTHTAFETEIKLGRFLPSRFGMALDILHSSNEWQLYLSAGGRLTYVVYDASMQGGWFQPNNPYTLSSTDIKNFHYQVFGGLSFSYSWASLHTRFFYQSPTFSQALYHRWLSLDFLFHL